MTAPAAPGRPPIPAVCDVHPDLADLHQWVCWKWDWRRKEQKWTKIPVKPWPVTKPETENASSTDPETWGTLGQARDHALASDGRLGIGVVVTDDDPFLGADIDHCLDPATGLLTDEAAAIVADLNSLTDVTVSGTGVRVWVRAHLPAESRKRGKNNPVELYCRGRFFTVTGQRLPGTTGAIKDRQAEVDALYQRYYPEPAPPTRPAPPARDAGADGLTVERVVERIRASDQGAKFDRLMRGDTAECGNNASIADYRLASVLAFWCDDDTALMAAIMNESSLKRDKWASRRGKRTYLDMTIENARAQVVERYDWRRPTLLFPAKHATQREVPTVGTSQPEAIATADTALGDTSAEAACPAQLAAALQVVGLQQELLVTWFGVADRWRRRAHAAETAAAEATATIRAMRDALANDHLGAERIAGVALAFEVASTLRTTPATDTSTGEIINTGSLAQVDARGFVKVYAGHGSESPEDGRPTAGLAAAIGCSAGTASRQIKKLADAGVIEIDLDRLKGHRTADGDIRRETWVRWRQPDADTAAAVPSITDLLAVVAQAGRSTTATTSGRHGDPERFKAVPKACPHCGSGDVRVVCGACHKEITVDLAPNHHHDGSETPAPPQRDPRSLIDHDGGSGRAERVAALHRTPVRTITSPTLIRPLDQPPRPGGPCAVAGCRQPAAYDNGPDGCHCKGHALFKRGAHSRPLDDIPGDYGQAAGGG